MTKVVPPAWNQLSFFKVQPGLSFHDVEEVYHAPSEEQLQKDGGRVRMAISGWFHIPQLGEDGYVEGAEEENERNSSLMQLSGNPDQYDMPRAAPVAIKEPKPTSEDEVSEADLEFLLKYMSPTYLTPDTLEQIQERFDEDSSITLPDLLNKKFGNRLRKYVEQQEATPLPESSEEIEKGPLKVAKPPHKFRYLYMQPSKTGQKNGKGAGKAKKAGEDSPVRELLDVFLPSPQFRRWLQWATSTVIESHDIMARRFRKGLDYTLATGHEEGPARLEINLGFTPTEGWGDEEDDEEEDEEDEEEEEPEASSASKKKQTNGKAKEEKEEEEKPAREEVGGHEVYMAGDDDTAEDAAVYKSSGDDDNILFFQAASWNKLTVVLRDSGTLKFVKYVSRRAPGDRWDISGTFEIQEQEDDDEEGEEEEEEFEGFSPAGKEKKKKNV